MLLFIEGTRGAAARDKLFREPALPADTFVLPTVSAGRPGSGTDGRWESMSTSLTARGAEPPQRTPPLRHLLTRERPDIGTGAAAKAVAEDVSALVRAELDLAKAEALAAVKPKARGAALLAVAAVAGWLALQGLLITAGFVLALFVPGWAAALIVTVVLLVVAGGAGLAGRRFLTAPVSLDTTKHNIEEDVSWLRAHLPKRGPKPAAPS